MGAWGYGNMDVAILSQAKRAVNAILDESELKELGEETDEFEQWRSTVVELLQRLG